VPVQKEVPVPKELPVEIPVEKEAAAEEAVKKKPNGMWATLTSAMSKKIGIANANENQKAPKEEAE
jgi:hypothetical protein